MEKVKREEIPLYDAEHDPHCTYTETQAFQASPYFREKYGCRGRILLTEALLESKHERCGENLRDGSKQATVLPSLPLEVEVIDLIRDREVLVQQIRVDLKKLQRKLKVSKARFQLVRKDKDVKTGMLQELFYPVVLKEDRPIRTGGTRSRFCSRIDEFFAGEEYPVRLLLKRALLKLSQRFVKVRFLYSEIYRRIQQWKSLFPKCQLQQSTDSMLNRDVFYYRNRDYLLYSLPQLNFISHHQFEVMDAWSSSQHVQDVISFETMYEMPFLQNPFLLPAFVYQSEIYFLGLLDHVILLGQVAVSMTEKLPEKVETELVAQNQTESLVHVQEAGRFSHPIMDVIDALRCDVIEIKQCLHASNGVSREHHADTAVLSKTLLKDEKLWKRNKRKMKRRIPKTAEETSIQVQEVEEVPQPCSILADLASMHKQAAYEKPFILPGYLAQEKDQGAMILRQQSPPMIRFRASKDYTTSLSLNDHIILFDKLDFNQRMINYDFKVQYVNYRILNTDLEGKTENLMEVPGIRARVASISPISLEVVVLTRTRKISSLLNPILLNSLDKLVCSDSSENYDEIYKYVKNTSLKMIKLSRIRVQSQKLKYKGSLFNGSSELIVKSSQTDDVRYDVFVGDVLRLDKCFVGRVLEINSIMDPDDERVSSYHELRLSNKLEVLVAGEIHDVQQDLVNARLEKLTFDSDKVTYQSLYHEVSKREAALRSASYSFFGYRMRGERAGYFVGEHAFNHQLCAFIEKLDTGYILRQIFEYLCFSWYPVTSVPELDNVKFMKFLKELPEVINAYDAGGLSSGGKGRRPGFLGLSQADLVFAKVKDPSKRRITYPCFSEQALYEVARQKYPWLDVDETDHSKQVVVKHFILNHVFQWKETSGIIYHEAKKLAYRAEARQQLAAKRLQTSVRGSLSYRSYQQTRTAISRIQHNFRCYCNQKEFRCKLRKVKEDLLKIKREQVLRKDARRQALVLAETLMISGSIYLVNAFRASENGLRLIVYNAETCASFMFQLRHEAYKAIILDSLKLDFLYQLPEHVSGQKAGIREIVPEMKDDLGAMADEAFDVSKLYSKRYVHNVLSRLKVKKSRGDIIIGKKRQATTSGELVYRQGVFLCEAAGSGKVFYVLCLYLCLGTILLAFYNPLTEQRKHLKLSKKEIFAHFSIQPDYSGYEEMSHQKIHRAGEAVILFQFQLEKDKGKHAATKLQSLYRRKQAIKDTKYLVRNCYRKQFDADHGQWYYVNVITNEASWEKPYILKHSALEEDIEKPSQDLWISYVDQASGQALYFHPSTGRTSKFSQDDAQQTIRKFYERKQAAAFRMNGLKDVVTALTLQHDIEDKYNRHPDKLSIKFNYGLFLLTNKLEVENAINLIRECLSDSPTNPLVRLADALCTLFQCDYPWEQNYEKSVAAIESVWEANGKTLDGVFSKAYVAFFHWGAVLHSSQMVSFLFCALCQQYIFKAYHLAGKFYNRAYRLMGETSSEEDRRRLEVHYTMFKKRARV